MTKIFVHHGENCRPPSGRIAVHHERESLSTMGENMHIRLDQTKAPAGVGPEGVFFFRTFARLTNRSVAQGWGEAHVLANVP